MDYDDISCDRCGETVWVTPSGFGVCPSGHGRLRILSDPQRRRARRVWRMRSQMAAYELGAMHAEMGRGEITLQDKTLHKHYHAGWSSRRSEIAAAKAE